ncbi:MAG: radical SAM protein [Candidatus Bathyarchaeia archaeon]
MVSTSGGCNWALEKTDLVRQVRVSLGSAIALGLLSGKIDVAPTTAYLMTYTAGKCTANCAFCPQARSSLSSADLLSRVSWPVFPVDSVLYSISDAFDKRRVKRVCIQALNYPSVFTHLVELVRAVKGHVDVPVSVSCQPLYSTNLRCLSVAGVERVGIALDAVTEELFERVKGSVIGGPYRWNDQFEKLREAVIVFGRGNVSTHLIVGLGETEKEVANAIQLCVDMHVLPALFAFTPVRGTFLEGMAQPQIDSYRRVQLARYLIVNGIARLDDLCFDDCGKLVSFGVQKDVLTRIVETGEPFLTSGCPSCNRPFYNEKPSGPIFNYPRKLRGEEVSVIKQQLCL